ncbi:MAG TPA: hypothetical protein VIT45_06085 [Allosphingosinicella sp.]
MSAPAAFEQLKSLAGEWRGQRPDGRTVEVRYRLSAAGSALVETWDLGPGVEALTVYHMDGRALMATHFCPQGNQPRLRMRPSVSEGRLDFDFQDSTGVEPGHWVQRAFWIELHPGGTFSRGETYAQDGEEETEAITYERLGS